MIHSAQWQEGVFGFSATIITIATVFLSCINIVSVLHQTRLVFKK